MLTVAKLGSVSTAKGMTQVVFVPANSEAPIWVSSWHPTEWVQAQVRPGVSITAEHIVFGKVENSYTDKNGVQVALKAPKQSVTFRGTIAVVVPESLPEAVYTSSDEASTYAQDYDARKAQVGDDTPI